MFLKRVVEFGGICIFVVGGVWIYELRCELVDLFVELMVALFDDDWLIIL